MRMKDCVDTHQDGLVQSYPFQVSSELQNPSSYSALSVFCWPVTSPPVVPHTRCPPYCPVGLSLHQTIRKFRPGSMLRESISSHSGSSVKRTLRPMLPAKVVRPVRLSRGAKTLSSRPATTRHLRTSLSCSTLAW